MITNIQNTTQQKTSSYIFIGTRIYIEIEGNASVDKAAIEEMEVLPTPKSPLKYLNAHIRKNIDLICAKGWVRTTDNQLRENKGDTELINIIAPKRHKTLIFNHVIFDLVTF